MDMVLLVSYCTEELTADREHEAVLQLG